MKTKFTLLLAVFALATMPALRADIPGDVLYVGNITVSGKIMQGPLVSGDSASLVPAGKLSVPDSDYMLLTIANVLKVLDITGVDPKTLQYYYDATIDGIVIAPKGLKNGDVAEPTAILVVFNWGVDWQKGPSRWTAGGPVTALGKALVGACVQKRYASFGRMNQITDFIAWGNVSNFDKISASGRETIIKGTVVDIYPNTME